VLLQHSRLLKREVQAESIHRLKVSDWEEWILVLF
jgi:hypothetical protein